VAGDGSSCRLCHCPGRQRVIPSSGGHATNVGHRAPVPEGLRGAQRGLQSSATPATRLDSEGLSEVRTTRRSAEPPTNVRCSLRPLRSRRRPAPGRAAPSCSRS
jgi:hypothetical protein